jgi:hypothetical protein
MGLTIVLLIGALLATMAYVRLAPVDAARWHQSPSLKVWANGGPWNEVTPAKGAASLRLSHDKGTPPDLLARLDAVAMATPRTRRLAGSVAEGRITWETRSALWGFPDYTTAEARPDGLYIQARLRFGSDDFGVNAKRLSDWLSRL